MYFLQKESLIQKMRFYLKNHFTGEKDFYNVFDLESMFRLSTIEDTRLDNVHELRRMAKETVLDKELSHGLLDFCK